MFEVVIFGAKSTALGICLAIMELCEDFTVIGFLVSSKTGNPNELAGYPVYELDEFERRDVCILIATPEDIQEEIVEILDKKGFHNHVCVNSHKESEMMERYYTKLGIFQSIHSM